MFGQENKVLIVSNKDRTKMVARVREASKFAGGDLYAEGRRAWRAFMKATSGMPGFDAFNKSKGYAIAEGLKEGTNLYTHFPFLFADAFPELSLWQLRKLSLMSLLYTYQINIADSLIDEGSSLPRECILAGDACSLRAFEILTQLFGPKPLPWKQIRKIHYQYALATSLDRGQHGAASLEYQRQDLINVLARRCAMAKLIPLTLCSLTGRDNYLGPLMKSFDLYYVGEQMVDDFRDWKKDLQAGRYSYLLTKVITAYDLRQKIERMDTDQATELVGKYFYLSGLADNYLEEVIDYYKQAKKCVEAISCPRWLLFLNALQMQIHVSQSNIWKRSRRFLLQTDKYAYRLISSECRGDCPARAQGKNDLPHPVPSVALSVFQACSRAAEFLRMGYKPGIGFEDFMMARGQLPVWISAYVGVSVVEWIKYTGEYLKKRHPLSRMLKQMASDFADKQSNDGWAPDEVSPEDADTSAWMMGFLLALGGIERHVIERGVESLLKYKKPDGGYSTYMPGKLDPNADGFTSSHVEVTAVILKILQEAGRVADEEIIVGGMNHVRSRQEADGLWQAYWWDGQMYSTYHCLRALRGFQRLPDQEKEKLTTRILSMQSPDGSWGEETIGKNKAFETALALKSLMIIDESLTMNPGVKSGIVWLLNHQAMDGGFHSGPMLRMPEFGDTQPWNKKDWKLDSIAGFNIIGRDQNRFFTTATVLSALTDFLTLAGDQRVIVDIKGELRSDHKRVKQRAGI